MIEIAPGVTAGVYSRKRSKFYQARVRIGDQLIRRSTHAITVAGALAGAKCWAEQLLKRGEPSASRIRADGLS